MSQFTFSYTEQEHPIFGQITRPLLKLAFYSTRFGEWLSVKKVLADTGADISVVPLPLGQILVPEVELGQPIQLGGILSSNLIVNGFVHQIQAKIGDYRFDMPIAVSTSSNIPPILGRQNALDRFKVHFIHGKELILEI
jgi:predicted aspartyl protease